MTRCDITEDGPPDGELGGETGQAARQPWLHELRICVDGNATVLSALGGDIEPGTVHGYYVDDHRVLGELILQVAGQRPTPLTGGASGGRAEFLASARNLGNPGPDPTVEVLRTRELSAGLTESVSLTSRADAPVGATLTLVFSCDEVDIGAVKAGVLHADPVLPRIEGQAVHWPGRWHASTATFTAPATRITVDGARVRAELDVTVPAGATMTWATTVVPVRTGTSVLDADPGSEAVDWSTVRVEADDRRLAYALRQGLDDVRHLLLRDPEDADDVFAAAGTPWYLTLFGRDSLWTARMLLPFGTELAAGTLRALARRQGTRHDPATAQAPGKIPHELRRAAYRDPVSGLDLAPVYYGTIDATALWVLLLAEARAWGMPEDQVRALTPALRSAVGWLRTDARPDPDGLLRYHDPTGTGLSNQGWKDSGDSIRWRDGRVADPPIALLEAQAYTAEALRAAAGLYRALGIDGDLDLDTSATQLDDVIRARYWVHTDAGSYLAIALDGTGHAVDGLASNMGHVLGTGVLTPHEVQTTAAALAGDELLDHFGLRTLGSRNGGYNPLGYHTGSIWAHDTVIAAWGLAREGRLDEATAVARALLNAAEVFHYRMPELYAGEATMGHPAPYPASCRPQAWSAASAGMLLSLALGLRPDAPQRTLHLHATRPTPFGALRVEGLRFAGHEFTAAVDPDGRLEVHGLPGDVDVRTAPTDGPDPQ